MKYKTRKKAKLRKKVTKLAMFVSLKKKKLACINTCFLSKKQYSVSECL